MVLTSGRHLAVLPYWEDNRVLLGVPSDIPFSVATVDATLRALKAFSAGRPTVGWNRNVGLRFSVPIRSSAAFRELALDTTTLPICAEQPRADKNSLPQVLFVDNAGTLYDNVAAFDPDRTVTTDQLNTLISGWLDGNSALGNDWSLLCENGCLALANSDASQRDFRAAVQPFFGATGSATVRIYCDESGERTKATTVSIKLVSKDTHFVPNTAGVNDRSNFEDIRVVSNTSVVARFVGECIYIEEPTELLKELNPVVVHFMRELGIHPALDGRLKVVLDQTHRSPDDSHDYDAVLSQRFPITPLYI